MPMVGTLSTGEAWMLNQVQHDENHIPALRLSLSKPVLAPIPFDKLRVNAVLGRP